MLSHLEFEQIKRALDRLRAVEAASGYQSSNVAVGRGDVIEILMPYVDGFVPPNPHPTPTIIPIPSPSTP